MILDSSALLAVLLREPEAERFIAAIADAERREISAANYVEAAIRLIGKREDPVPLRRLDEFAKAIGLTLVPVTPGQAGIAIDAYRDFRKGSGHPAQLNYGDCFAYALAKETRQSLLFKGNDFIHTDIEAAVSG